MKVRVTDIKDEALHIRTSMVPEWLENIPELLSGNGDLSVNSNIDIDLQVTKVLRQVSILGKVSLSVTALCSRCLESVELVLCPEVRLLLLPDDKLNGKERDIVNETYSGDEVDLGDYIRELVAIAIPYKVVCDKNCRGLCSSCGLNLNEMDCFCAEGRVDSRFAVLRDLKV